MASIANNTLLRTMKVSEHFCRNAPLSGVGGDPTEPAMSMGDWVRNFILSPPFAWRWNRGSTTITTVAGTQDYNKTLTDFGWMEKASCDDGANTGTSIVELEIKLNLSEDNAKSQPRFIAARLDDDNNVISFRLLPNPDAVYTINVAYQKACPTFANLSDTWGPIPDYLSHIYSMGFLGRAYEYFDDPRYSFTFQMFLRQLLAANEGLTESQKNIFMSEFLDGLRQQQGQGINTQFTKQGRSGF